jgi:hypothetical protein
MGNWRGGKGIPHLLLHLMGIKKILHAVTPVSKRVVVRLLCHTVTSSHLSELV